MAKRNDAKRSTTIDSINSLSRIVQIKQRLLDGEELHLDELCNTYGKHPETIKKDISIIRNELTHKPVEIEYSRVSKSYKLIGSDSNSQFVYAIVILMMMHGSRSLSAAELRRIEDFITESFSPQLQQWIHKYTNSFRHYYKPIIRKDIFALIETIFDCIVHQKRLQIDWMNNNKEINHFEVFPYTLIFDEGYFYMIAEPQGATRIEGMIFRVDRIVAYKVMNARFEISQSGQDFFKPGEFANYSFLMHSGETNTVIRLKMRPYIESYFIAKFPIHQLIESGKDWLIYECTVSHAESALFWIFSERQWVEVLSPLSLREKVKATLQEMLDMYKDD